MSKIRLIQIISQYEESTMWIETDAEKSDIKQAISDANYGYERDLDWSTCFYDSLITSNADYTVNWTKAPEKYYMD